MWIDKEYKKIYSDASVKGLRLKFSEHLDNELVVKIKDFIKFLRKRYYFPIRCTIWIKPTNEFFEKDKSKKSSIGDFYYYEDHLKKTPLIWIATGRYHYASNSKKEMEIKNILFTIAHELTHYFQWYFLEFDTRTDRSLEIEANKWANSLVYEYLSLDDFV